jgi:hypothetical protein
LVLFCVYRKKKTSFFPPSEISETFPDAVGVEPAFSQQPVSTGDGPDTFIFFSDIPQKQTTNKNFSDL